MRSCTKSIGMHAPRLLDAGPRRSRACTTLHSASPALVLAQPPAGAASDLLHMLSASRTTSVRRRQRCRRVSNAYAPTCARTTRTMRARAWAGVLPHGRVRPRACASLPTRACARVSNTCAHARVRTRTRTRTGVSARARTRTRTHPHMRTRTRTRTRASVPTTRVRACACPHGGCVRAPLRTGARA